jgi:hypothetical protein
MFHVKHFVRAIRHAAWLGDLRSKWVRGRETRAQQRSKWVRGRETRAQQALLDEPAVAPGTRIAGTASGIAGTASGTRAELGPDSVLKRRCLSFSSLSS